MTLISSRFGSMAFAQPQRRTFDKSHYMSMFNEDGQNAITENWAAYQQVVKTAEPELRDALQERERLWCSRNLESAVEAIRNLGRLDSRFAPNGQFFECMLMDFLIQRQVEPTAGQVNLVLNLIRREQPQHPQPRARLQSYN